MNPLPIIINNLQFAKQKQALSGALDAMAFDRISETLVATDQQGASLNPVVRYQLSGWMDVQHRPFLKLEIDAHLSMICQRCLSAMPVHLNLSFTYMVTSQTEEEMLVNEEMDDAIDLLAENERMDVGLLIEDELLMALPIAPVHADACAHLAMSSGDKVNPFAALEKLKNTKK